MTVRRDRRRLRGHAVRANGWGYFFHHAWKDAAYYTKHRRLVALCRCLFWVLGFGYYGETCQVCGRPYVLWRAPDDIYQQVVGDAGGLFCPNCFDRAAGKAGLDLQWVPQRFGGPPPVGVVLGTEEKDGNT